MGRAPVMAHPTALPARVETSSACHFWSRTFAAVPLPPWIVGAGLAFGIFVGLLVFDWIDGNLAALVRGEVPVWLHAEVRGAVLAAAMLAGLLVTYRYEELATQRDVTGLLPQLDLGEDTPTDIVTTVCTAGHRHLAAAGAFGALVSVALGPALDGGPWRGLAAAPLPSPSAAFDLTLVAIFGWAAGRTLYASLRQDLAFARLSERVARIDLLDLAPLRSFARRALRRTFRWLILVAIGSLVFLDRSASELPVLALCAIALLALCSFGLPLHGVHRRIRREKLDLLDALRWDIRTERARLHGDRHAPGGHLADLLAYEARIAAVREWPIDTRHLVHFALYLLIPLGSWLGGAFVERAVNAALD